MWFASIWIFTLKLPWQQGAAFFLEHLLDGDSASNTLSWRWVAGLQTKGKHYLAKSWNIEKFTENRFTNIQLNESAVPIIENKFYEICPMSYSNKDINNEILIVFDTDLFIDQYLKSWVGYCEETLFDINLSVIDSDNVMAISQNSQVYDRLESLGITVHKVPFRHRFFWDGGLHCITNDLVREIS